MSLISRLAGIGTDETSTKIAFNQFLSGLREIQRGNLTQAGLVNALDLSQSEQSQAQTLYTKLTGMATNDEREKFIAELAQIFDLCEMEIDDSANGGINYTDASEVTARILAI